MTERATQPSLLEPSSAPPEVEAQSWAAIARVAIDSPLPHLDRLFDYGIPAQLQGTAQVGSRVGVRFAGRNVDGFIIDLIPSSTQTAINPIRRVIGKLPVITPEILELCTRIARRYAGGLADVLRLAVPPRHATAEKKVLSAQDSAPSFPPGATRPEFSDTPWLPYPAGKAFLRRLADGENPRAVWSALPTPGAKTPQEWARAITSATQATLRSGRGVLIVVPTATDLAIVAEALTEDGVSFIKLTAEMGPSARYESFLGCLLGHSRVVLGTRAAAYAPVANLGLIVCWDEVHDGFCEPRAPYPHVRETLAMRSTIEATAALFGGFARSPQAQHFVATGWAHHLGAERQTVRERTPRVLVPDDHDRDREGPVGHTRIPGFAWRKIREVLETGPVLLQVPRAGFTPGLACTRCRSTARCTLCRGPISASESSLPACSWCGHHATDWRCAHCENTTWRARSVGAQRTAEELGRAFPGVPVRVSGRGAGRLGTVPDEPALIIATPGAEPPARSGYPLAVLLDGALLTDRPYLNAPVSALHHWLRAGALSRGEVIVLGEPLMAPAQAAVRWDPAGYAQRELAEWSQLGFPPTHTVVTVTGEKTDVAAFQRYLPEVEGTSILGPVPIPGEVDTPADGELGIPVRTPLVRLLLRIDSARHLELTDAVRSAVRIRSAKRDGLPIRVKVNPTEEL